MACHPLGRGNNDTQHNVVLYTDAPQDPFSYHLLLRYYQSLFIVSIYPIYTKTMALTFMVTVVMFACWSFLWIPSSWRASSKLCLCFHLKFIPQEMGAETRSTHRRLLGILSGTGPLRQRGMWGRAEGEAGPHGSYSGDLDGSLGKLWSSDEAPWLGQVTDFSGSSPTE